MARPITARVARGRLIFDEPVNMPEGTEFELILTPKESAAGTARLRAALSRADEQIRQGKDIDARRAVARLRGRVGMKRYRVRFTLEALAQAAAVRTWFATMPAAKPELFLRELDATLHTLEIAPYVGTPCEVGDTWEVRRLRLPRVQYAVYYTVAERLALVRVLAVWRVERSGRATRVTERRHVRRPQRFIEVAHSNPPPARPPRRRAAGGRGPRHRLH